VQLAVEPIACVKPPLGALDLKGRMA